MLTEWFWSLDSHVYGRTIGPPMGRINIPQKPILLSSHRVRSLGSRCIKEKQAPKSSDSVRSLGSSCNQEIFSGARRSMETKALNSEYNRVSRAAPVSYCGPNLNGPMNSFYEARADKLLCLPHHTAKPTPSVHASAEAREKIGILVNTIVSRAKLTTVVWYRSRFVKTFSLAALSL